MPKIKWTYNKLDFIKLNLHLSDKVLGEYFNTTETAIKTIRRRYKILRKYNYYSKKEEEYLKTNYANTKTEKLAKKLKRSISSIYSHAKLLGLKKSKEFLAGPESGIFIKGSTVGIEYRFQKGHTPANKGQKMSDELKEKVKHTFFQIGHKPHNTKHDEAVTIRKDRKGHSYKYLRISENNWEELHRHNWKKTKGPIPKGYNIVFKDGNSMNCDINNLELITDAELLERNRITQWPPELQEVIKMNNKLKKQIDGRH